MNLQATEERPTRRSIPDAPIQTPKVVTTIETITPDKAKEMLAKNVNNRPKSKTVIEAYSNALTNGEWVLNGDPIRFDWDGRLLDGQHRLEAVLRSGVSMPAIVIRGLHPQSFGTMDRGKRRTVGDDLAIEGEKYTAILGAICRGIVMLRNPTIPHGLISSTLVRRQLDEFPRARFWAARLGDSRKFMPSSFGSVLTLAGELHGTNRLEEFHQQVVSGANIGKGDPAYTLRERFLFRGPSTQFSQQYALALMVKATNAFTHGRKIQILKFLETEDFPEIV